MMSYLYFNYYLGAYISNIRFLLYNSFTQGVLLTQSLNHKVPPSIRNIYNPKYTYREEKKTQTETRSLIRMT